MVKKFNPLSFWELLASGLLASDVKLNDYLHVCWMILKTLSQCLASSAKSRIPVMLRRRQMTAQLK